MKRIIDEYSYKLGAADAFMEMIRSGTKKLALSHPCDSLEERDDLLDDYINLANKYKIKYYLEDSPLITDLFPASLNKNKCNILFYLDDEIITTYLNLKQEKEEAIKNNIYQQKRYDIAYKYGKLLSYQENRIDYLIKNNNEKE